MRALKIFLGVTGLLIATGFIYIGVEVYHRMTDPERRTDPAERVMAVPAVPGLTLPTGTRVGDLVAVGNRVVFRASVPDQGDRLYLIDPRTGVVSALVVSGVAEEVQEVQEGVPGAGPGR